MTRFKYVCTDPSHPPLAGDRGGRSLYSQVKEAIVRNQQDGLAQDEVTQRVSAELISRLTTSSDSWADVSGKQYIRRQVSEQAN